MKVSPYIHLYSSSLNPCSLAAVEGARTTQAWLCPGCSYARPNVAPINVNIQELNIRDKPLNGTVLLGFIHDDLLQCLDRSAVQRDVVLGHIYNGRGQLLAKWHTFRCRRQIIVRGTKHAGYRICEDCGRYVYTAMGTRYLYPAPQDDTYIFESNLAGMVFRSSVLDHVDLKMFRRVIVDKLDVLDPPLDGLGVLPIM